MVFVSVNIVNRLKNKTPPRGLEGFKNKVELVMEVLAHYVVGIVAGVVNLLFVKNNPKFFQFF